MFFSGDVPICNKLQQTFGFGFLGDTILDVKILDCIFSFRPVTSRITKKLQM